MTAAAVLLLPVAYIRGRISRWEGAVFLAFYAAYVLFLLLSAQQHEALEPFSEIMLFFVIPVVSLVLIVMVVEERRTRAAAGRGRRRLTRR